MQAVTIAHGERVYYSNETARKTAAMVNIPGGVYAEKYKVNNLTDRYGAYSNALVLLTDSPSFPDARGVAKERPDNFQRREPW